MTTTEPKQASDSGTARDSERSRAKNVFLIPQGIDSDNLEALVGQPVLVDRRRIKYTPPTGAGETQILPGVGELHYETGPVEIGLLAPGQAHDQRFLFGVPVTKRMYWNEKEWLTHPNEWIPDLPFTASHTNHSYIGGVHLSGANQVLVAVGTEAFERYFTKTVQNAWQSVDGNPADADKYKAIFLSRSDRKNATDCESRDRTEQELYVTAMDALGLEPNPAYVQDWAGRIVAEAYSNIKSQVEPEKMSLAAQQGIAALQPLWHMHRDAIVTAVPGERTVDKWYYAFINITMRASGLKSSMDEL